MADAPFFGQVITHFEHTLFNYPAVDEVRHACDSHQSKIF
jgi:hypothetical protein